MDRVTVPPRAGRPAATDQLSPVELAATRHLLTHGPSSRAGLGEVLQLSYASTSRLARSLVDEGLVAEDRALDAVVGRPRQILSAVPGARHVVGVKLTGQVAYAVACDMFGTVIAAANSPLPDPSSDGVVPTGRAVRVIVRLVRKLAKQLPSLDGVGLALGGLVVDHSTVVEATFLGWHDIDLVDLIGTELAVPVTVSNDVAALAREQLWFGAGRTHSTFGVITVGAGLGFGLVREGRVVERLIDNGHLLAHSPIDGSGPRCTLGHSGCAAAFLNREDIEARASRRLRRRVTFADLAAGRSRGNAIMSEFIDDALTGTGAPDRYLRRCAADRPDRAGRRGRRGADRPRIADGRGHRRATATRPTRVSTLHPRRHDGSADIHRLGSWGRRGGDTERARRLLTTKADLTGTKERVVNVSVGRRGGRNMKPDWTTRRLDGHGDKARRDRHGDRAGELLHVRHRAASRPRQSRCPGSLLFAADASRCGRRRFLARHRGREYRLGLVNTPEYDECFGSEATAKRKELTAHGFRADVYAQDAYGRGVSLVTTADGVNVNVYLARYGYANDRYLSQYRHENPQLASQLDTAFAKARKERLGLWSACQGTQGAPVPPAPTTAPPVSTYEISACHPDYLTCIRVEGDGSGSGDENDLDCGSIGDAVKLRRNGVDPYRLDADGDGIGCQSN